MAGMLTQEQISEIKEAFYLFDVDGKGRIETNKLGIIIRSLGINLTDNELNDIVEEVDFKEIGSFDLDEFINIMNKIMKDENIEEELIKAFNELDRDGDGLISLAELRDAMIELEKKIICSEVYEPAKEIDLDYNEYINLEKFLLMLKF